MYDISKKYAELLNKKEFTANLLTSPYKWEKIDPSKNPGKKKLFGICRHCMQGDCSTWVHMEDGIVTKIEGREDVPPNFGSLCPRGNSAIMGLYNPYRIKTPLVRTNPQKGLDIDPMWKEVTWDEALDLVASELRKAYDYDPRSICVNEGWGQRDTILRPAWQAAFKTPNEIGSHGALCTVHYGTGLIHGNFPVSLPDLEYCNYHITVGRSVGANFSTTGGSRKLMRAIERGMRLIVVDPRCSQEASKGEWVPIRPGADLYFLLGMANVLFYEGLELDWYFLKNRTNSCYLLTPDGDYAKDPETGLPIVWDTLSGKAVVWNTEGIEPALEGTYDVNGVSMSTSFTTVKSRFAEYTPEWAEKLCDIPAETIRRIANEFVEYAQIGRTIEIEGFTFPFRPVALNLERNSMNHRWGVYADLTGKLINMMVGAIEVPGGCLGSGYRGPDALRPGPDGMMSPGYEAKGHGWKFPPDHVGLVEFFPHSHTTPHLTVQAIEDPEKFHLEYHVKFWLTMGANVIRSNAEPERYVDMFRKIPFTCTIALHMDEPAIMSEVLLPEHSFLERKRVIPFFPSHQSVDRDVMGLQMIQYREPVPAIFNTMHVDDILIELAERAGRLYGEGGLNDCINNGLDFLIREHGLNMVDPYKLDLNTRYTMDEIWDRQLKGWMFGDGSGLKELEEKGSFINWQPRKTFYHYYHWPENQTKHEFYFINLKRTADRLKAGLAEANIKFPCIENEDDIFDLYDPVPHYVETYENLAAPEDYDLYAINWKPSLISSDVGNLMGNPWITNLFDQDPIEKKICFNPVTAAKKGLQNDDWVRVTSMYGWVEGPVIISERFHPDAVGIGGFYGPGAKGANPENQKGPHFNRLLSCEIKTVDPVSAGQEVSPRVKVEKIKTPKEFRTAKFRWF
ncbi:MAG: hypothetical protein E7224_02445 [Clostridiales bacterium]|nr:hypothetical protein [Clostridiales bacterium]